MKRLKILIKIFLVFLFFIIGAFSFNFLIEQKFIIKMPKFIDFSLIKMRKEAPFFLYFFEKTKKQLIFEEKDFLEVNISEMKVKVFKKGILNKEVPILAKGDPQGWGGTAVGLYKANSKTRIAFSVVSEVYMPYAIGFYGKYYIHGEPYYPGGTPLVSSVSGGCIRLSNKDAKEIFNSTEIGMAILVIDKEKDDFEYPEKKLTRFPNVSAESYLVGDLDSGFIFAAKDYKKEFQIASISKLMTAIVVTENIDLVKYILVKEEMLEPYGSTKGLEAGEMFRLIELLYPLLIESSNDAAEIMSFYLGKEKTIKLMNEKAKAILMEQTEFSDPSGFDQNNVSNAKDLFYLARYILNNRPPILEITKGKKAGYSSEISFDIENLWNKNIFINDPTFIGGKTGFIKTSKETALFMFRLTTKESIERNIVICLLGSDNEEFDTQKIYIWLQKNYFKE